VVVLALRVLGNLLDAAASATLAIGRALAKQLLPLELECLAAVFASCHRSVTIARLAVEAGGQIGPIFQAASSAASARQHDADALVLGSYLARR
jgi:hypothetical protein